MMIPTTRVVLLATTLLSFFVTTAQVSIDTIAPGVIRITMGEPDTFTPYRFCTEQPRTAAMQTLSNTPLPFNWQQVQIQHTSRGIQVRVPLQPQEQLYGFGMQIGSFEQRGMRRRPIVNDRDVQNIGYTHAPQPFYVSTAGYGVLVNTARYTTFLCGSNQELTQQPVTSNQSDSLKFTTNELYARQAVQQPAVWIDVPGAKGIELFFFEGATLKESVQRYNLFSGGGALPPLWGLGIKYRVKGDFKQDGVYTMAQYFRNNHIPCDVIGLEPGWHTKSYSCSYAWSNKFPRPQELIDSLQRQHLRLNLWEHAYVNPLAPFYAALQPYAGSFTVWNGLVPDFADTTASGIFARYHEQALVNKGISGFKLDECDNSNIIDGKATWGFPDMTRFPSGIDGEQMHQLFGSLYARTLLNIYKQKNQRTYFDYRCSNLFNTSLPAVLYSDIYGHSDYISMISTASFGGLLWSPELRDSKNETDFIRRTQTLLLAPQSVVDAWFLTNAPWFQLNRKLNNDNVKHEHADSLERLVRQLFRERMSLIPYLYSAFADYYEKGIPPFRPLVMDYSADKNTWSIANQYMIGSSLMAAPTTMDSTIRSIYFPEGTWYDYYTHQTYTGGQLYQVSIPFNQLPLWVKAGSIIPVAAPVEYIADNTVFEITGKVFGTATASFRLYEDDGLTYNYQKGQYNTVTLNIVKGKGKITRTGNFKTNRYHIKSWEYIK